MPFSHIMSHGVQNSIFSYTFLITPFLSLYLSQERALAPPKVIIKITLFGNQPGPRSHGHTLPFGVVFRYRCTLDSVQRGKYIFVSLSALTYD